MQLCVYAMQAWASPSCQSAPSACNTETETWKDVDKCAGEETCFRNSMPADTFLGLSAAMKGLLHKRRVGGALRMLQANLRSQAFCLPIWRESSRHPTPQPARPHTCWLTRHSPQQQTRLP